jgi:hypothetical protein
MQDAQPAPAAKSQIVLTFDKLYMWIVCGKAFELTVIGKIINNQDLISILRMIETFEASLKIGP